MLLELRIPKINEHMSNALIENLYAEVDNEIMVGQKIFDLSVDLGSAFSQDCPPISYYRLVLRERVWLRKRSVTVGEQHDAGTVMAIFSTEPDEPDGGIIARQVRVATAGIMYHSAMWSGRNG